MKRIVFLAALAMLQPAVAAEASDQKSATTNAPPAVVESAKAPAKASGSDRRRADGEFRQCEATTLSGNRCKRRAAKGSRYCRQHEAIIRKRDGGKDGK